MNDFIDGLLARSLGREDLISPRTPTSFEEWQNDMPDDETDALEVVDTPKPRWPVPQNLVMPEIRSLVAPLDDGLDLPESIPASETGVLAPARAYPPQRQPEQPPPGENETTDHRRVREPVLRVDSVVTTDRIVLADTGPDSPPGLESPSRVNVVVPTEMQAAPASPEPVQPSPERTTSGESQLTPTPTASRVVKVTIGRIEVKIPQSKPQPKPEFVKTPRQTRYRPPVSLSEYMSRREG